MLTLRDARDNKLILALLDELSAVMLDLHRVSNARNYRLCAITFAAQRSSLSVILLRWTCVFAVCFLVGKCVVSVRKVCDFDMQDMSKLVRPGQRTDYLIRC
jgi:hypothetical protein